MVAREELESLLTVSDLSPWDFANALLAAHEASLRPLAFAVLAKHIAGSEVRSDYKRSARGVLQTWLYGSDVQEHINAFEAFRMLFQINGELGAETLKDDSVAPQFSECIQLYEVPKQKTSACRLSLARLLAVVSSFTATHAFLTECKALDWARTTCMATAGEDELRAAAAVTVVKLSKHNIDAEILTSLQSLAFRTSSQQFALEGLAVASLQRQVKVILAKNQDFVKSLCALGTSRRLSAPTGKEELQGDVALSVVSILANLAVYPATLTEEQLAYEKLQHLSLKGQGPDGVPSVRESRAAVDERNDVLLRAGAATALVRLIYATSVTVKSTAAAALLAFAEQSSRRGALLQAGASKALLAVASESESVDLPAAQALAKLLITSNPAIALNSPGSLLDAISILSRLLLHPEATSLQQFEAMMALTNISSHSSGLAERIADREGVLDAVETYMLESEPPLRCRAATELACNLSGTTVARARWQNKRAATIFLALTTGVREDEALALAAAGALAQLGGGLAEAVLDDEKLCSHALDMITEASCDGLALRGLVFLGEIATAEPAKAKGRFETAVKRLLSEQARPQDIRDTAQELLKVMMCS